MSIPARFRRPGGRWRDVEVVIEGELEVGEGDAPAPAEHPDLAAHTSLGLAGADHAHDTAHGHEDLAEADHEHDTTHSHPEYAADHDHPYAATAHDHDGSYEAPHGHPYAADDHDHENLAADDHAHPHDHDAAYSASAHTHAIAEGDIPASIARDAEVSAAIATHLAAEPHEEATAIPAGVIVMWGGLVSAIPSGWLLCNGANGTPDLRDRFVKGAANGANPGTTGGAATHTHADHAALTHSGAAVADHTVTQPTAAAEAAHTHTYSQVPNHVHVQSINTATTGGAVGHPALKDTSTSGSEATGLSTANPTGGVAQGTTAAGASHTHAMSGAAVSAHGVTQPSQHAAQSHAAGSSEPAFYALCFIQKA